MALNLDKNAVEKQFFYEKWAKNNGLGDAKYNNSFC